ncbi:MAG: DUF108 domain-containing protein [Spirochaetes bacterium]|uniref:L-aspartate dehydrogenase n=1 Tax=Candidatus Ornithospirochaeta stercoripullorum TaxID=2840899 RepID=A0A9D9H549_9SPIO|nr:DUF108 domain-containing protein [Candidatus Ornithospirochaeta stercoripullorum]
MKTFAIAGCGHLGRIVYKAYINGLLEDYQLIATYSLKKEDAEALTAGTEAKALESIESVIALKPDFIIETASIALLKEFAIKALDEGISIIPLSIGAFADEEFKNEALKSAVQSGAKIYIPSGAVGGFDVLNTIALIAKANGQKITAGIHTHKGPDSLKNTPLYTDELQDKEQSVFSGTTKEAIALLPTKVNVAVASALATIGPDKAKAEITSVPKFIGDDHCITVETDGLKAIVDIYSATSDIAAWSIVALLRNLSSSMVFF